MKYGFAKMHPIVSFVYFAAVIGFSMVFRHPVLLAISFFCAFSYSVVLKGRRRAVVNLMVLVPLILVTAIVNPLFNHRGVTIIFYLPSGNPVTLESIAFGISAGMMLATVLCLFSCFNEIMTSDKLIYLMGRLAPTLGLVLSMSLGFVSKFSRQIKNIILAQKGIGRDLTCGSVGVRIRNAAKIISAQITYALENSLETADSMKSRGYGLKGRTTFSNFTLSRRDKSMLAVLFLLIILIITAAALKITEFTYFPAFEGGELSYKTYIVFLLYLILFCVPMIVGYAEVMKWKKLK